MKPKPNPRVEKQRSSSPPSSQSTILALAANQNETDSCTSGADQESLQRLKRGISEAMDGFSLHDSEGIYTFVAVDETGTPVPVPELVPETELEKEL